MRKISLFLLFEDNSEEVVNLHVSVFDDAHVTHTARYPEGGPGPAGEVEAPRAPGS